MADEVLPGSGGGADILVAKVSSRLARLLLADRASLRNHPALMNAGPDLYGAATEKTTLYGLDGYDEMAAVAEATAVANRALITATFDLTPARQAIAREVSDQMRTLDPHGYVQPQRLAMSAVGAAMMRFTTLIAAIGDDFTTVKGTTTVAFSHDTFLAGKRALEAASVPGPYIMVLHPDSFSDWQEDLESRGGITLWNPATLAMQIMRGPGYKGEYDGIDVFVTTRVQSANAGADWANFVFGAGGIAFKELPIRPTQSMFLLLNSGAVLVEEERTARSALTGVVAHYHVGVAKAENGRGVVLIGAQA